MTVKRGYQGDHRFILEDLENEWTRRLTVDQVQAAFLRLELLEKGELPEMCKICKFREDEDANWGSVLLGLPQ